jgi:hypothetical protein
LPVLDFEEDFSIKSAPLLVSPALELVLLVADLLFDFGVFDELEIFEPPYGTNFSDVE